MSPLNIDEAASSPSTHERTTHDSPREHERAMATAVPTTTDADPRPPTTDADTVVTVAPTRPGRFRIDSPTSLWRAAEYGDVGRLKTLLAAGHDVNELSDDRGSRGKSVLSAAVDGNAPLAVRLLLRRGANPNLRDGDGDRYPLHWASAFGDHAECAELLVQAGAVLDARDAKGHTPLEFALGSATGRVHSFARFGSSLLGRPAGRPLVVKVLTDAAVVAVERRPAWSPAHAKAALSSAFWKAAAAGDMAVLQRCLDGGQPVDQPRPEPVNRMSALMIATYHSRLDAVQLLLERHANPNAAEATSAGFTALHLCAHEADRDAVHATALEPRRYRHHRRTCAHTHAAAAAYAATAHVGVALVPSATSNSRALRGAGGAGRDGIVGVVMAGVSPAPGREGGPDRRQEGWRDGACLRRTQPTAARPRAASGGGRAAAGGAGADRRARRLADSVAAAADGGDARRRHRCRVRRRRCHCRHRRRRRCHSHLLLTRLAPRTLSHCPILVTRPNELY